MTPSTMISRALSLWFALLFWFAVAALGGCGVKLPAVPGTQGLAPGAREVAPVVSTPARAALFDDDGSDSIVSDPLRAVAIADPDRGDCAVDVMQTARDQGLVGPCWDPPGAVEFAPPIHVTPGMRQMRDDLYWFDMPAEGEIDLHHGCPALPGARGNWFRYEPYAEDGGQPAPAIPNLTGKTVAEALALLDALDTPLCVQTIAWSSTCDVEVGAVCDQNVHDEFGKVNLLVRAAAK